MKFIYTYTSSKVYIGLNILQMQKNSSLLENIGRGKFVSVVKNNPDVDVRVDTA